MLKPAAPRPKTEEDLRRDRRTALIALVIMAALMAIIVWLSSLTNGSVHEGIDYWPMVP